MFIYFCFLFKLTEGSEDELEITSQSDDIEINLQKMVPPQNDIDVSSIKMEIDCAEFTNNNAFKSLVMNNDRNLKISLKSADELYARDRLIKQEHTNNDLYNKYSFDKMHNEQHNGYNFNEINYLRAKEKVINSNVLPNELELGDCGVYAKCTIIKGTKYGPFQGKWAGTPQHLKFAWEVSTFKKKIFFFVLHLLHLLRNR